MTEQQPCSSATGLLAGALWSAALLVAFGADHTFPAQSLSYRVTVALLCLFAGAAHAGVVGLFATACSSVGRSRWASSLGLALAHVVIAFVYAVLGIALLKLVVVGSHLALSDFRFVALSAGQLARESTGTERTLAVVALLLLPALALTIAFACRRLAPTARHVGLRELTVLALCGCAGLSLLVWRDPTARWITRTLFPDTRAVAIWLFGAGSQTVEAGAWQRDAARLVVVGPHPPPASHHRWNVVIVMLESVPWARLWGPAARPESTPNLTRLAQESVVFDRAYATSTHSDYAQTSILASLHPRKFDEHDFFLELDYPRTLPWDVLGPLGYRSAVFSCQNESWGNMRAFLSTPALGLLRHAPDWPGVARRGDTSASRRAFAHPLDVAFRSTNMETKVFEETVVESFFDWVNQDPTRPFVAYLNFQATHFPYEPSPGFVGPYQPAAIDFPASFLRYPRNRVTVMLDRWHNALAYVDREFGRLLSGLAANGTLDETALLVVSDHGEAFYEAGYVTHGTSLREEQLRTAMLLRAPGLRPRRIDESVSVLDAVPSLFALMGFPPHGNWQGRSDVLHAGYRAGDRPLLATIQGLTREDGIVRGNVQYIFNWDRQQPLLLDLRQPAARQHDFVAAPPWLRRELHLLLQRELDVQVSYYAQRGWRSGYYPPRIP